MGGYPFKLPAPASTKAPRVGLCSCFQKKRPSPWLEAINAPPPEHFKNHHGFLAVETRIERVERAKTNHPLVRNFKSMSCIANMFDLRGLTRFSMICRSFYWISGRKHLITKFYKKEEDSVMVNYIQLSKSLSEFRKSSHRSRSGANSREADRRNEKEFQMLRGYGNQSLSLKE